MRKYLCFDSRFCSFLNKLSTNANCQIYWFLFPSQCFLKLILSGMKNLQYEISKVYELRHQVAKTKRGKKNWNLWLVISSVCFWLTFCVVSKVVFSFTLFNLVWLGDCWNLFHFHRILSFLHYSERYRRLWLGLGWVQGLLEHNVLRDSFQVARCRDRFLEGGFSS